MAAMRSLLLLPLVAAACAALPAPSAEGPPRDDILVAAEAAANAGWAGECGPIVVPERALIPITLSGRAFTVVSYGRIPCPRALGQFSGTGGPLVQVWTMDGDDTLQVLETQMHGFRVEEDRFVTDQHGAECPGGAGPAVCRVTYAWSGSGRGLQVVERRLDPPDPMVGAEGRLQP